MNHTVESIVGDSAPHGSDTERLIAARVRQRLFDRPADSAHPAHPDHPAHPAQIGRFTVLEPIGRGGMGTVYAAYDDKLDRKVAIKVLLDQWAGLEARRRFQREAQAMARLSHPNVVTVHEVGHSEGEVFMAMEFVHGQSLDAWIRTEPGWAEVLEVFIQAGEGLVAAHQAGLVHRDLKPHNIMRGEDGTVKVLDFGLARAASDETLEMLEDYEVPEGSGSALDSFTRTGTVMGTPAYMSPEQLQGETADARSDQFGFCVALYEGLYGERPYKGTSMQALRASMNQRGVRPAPKGSRVPAAVRKVLLRGLHPDPARRWPSMQALLEPLRTQIAPRRWGVLALSVGIGLVGLGAGVGADRYAAWANRCAGASDHLEGTWDDARRQQVEAALLRTGLPYAIDVGHRVEQRLDEYAATWADAHTEACEATAIRHEQSEEHLGLRMSCLHQRRQHLRITVDELIEADPTVVAHAVQAVTSMPSLSRCADINALAAQIPSPDDPAVAQRVAALDEQLTRAEAKQKAGRYAEALARTQEVVAEATSLDYEPLMARAWLRAGILQRQTGAYDQAAATLQKAYDAALAQTLTAQAARAAVHLVLLLSTEQARYPEARRWVVHADALSRASRSTEIRTHYLRSQGALALAQGMYDEARTHLERALALQRSAEGSDPIERAATLDNLGDVALVQGRIDQARELLRRALAVRQAVLGPEHPEVAATVHDLGNTFLSRDEAEKAREHFERALAIKQEALGPDHPSVAQTLTSIGQAAKLQGQHEQAHALLLQSLAIKEKTLGPDHPDVASTLNSMGNTAVDQGKLDEAGAYFERALAIKERTLGPDHPDVGVGLNNLSTVVYPQGKLDEARQLLERTLAIFEKSLGPNHLKVGSTLGNLGTVTLSQGELDVALGYFHRALALRQKIQGPDHPHVADALTDIGKTRLAQGKPAEALPPLERALVVRARAQIHPVFVAQGRFYLARALWDAPRHQGRDRIRARRLARQAQQTLATMDPVPTGVIALSTVEDWLTEHPAGARAR
ncbi:MAG: tetratricopeptide repeat protein [Myxococcota bacterium]